VSQNKRYPTALPELYAFKLNEKMVENLDILSRKNGKLGMMEIAIIAAIMKNRNPNSFLMFILLFV
jgi:hypothetical protein